MNEKPKIEIIGLEGIPLIKEGDDISKIIISSLKKNNISLENGDIFVIAQTIISKSNGRVINLNEVAPTQEAIDIHKKMRPKLKKMGLPIKSPELIQVIINESNDIIREDHVLITETTHGFICANAGVDKSNVEGKNNVSLLPTNPDDDAERIRRSIKQLTNKDVAIIVSDSFGRPFRVGAVGVALGVSGIDPLLDKRGCDDLYGQKLQTTIVGQIDNLASAAQLLMGESNEGLPIILIRNYKYKFKGKVSIKSILRDENSDLFREKKSEAELFELLKSRRSYKFKFDSRDVDRKTIEDCIKIAGWAPSAHNNQQWKYLILEKNDLRVHLIEQMNKKLKSDLKNEGKSAEFIEKKINKTKLNFLDCPYLILLCLDENGLEQYSDEERTHNEFLLGIQSISASATYLLLAFQAKKLSACWYCAPLFTKQIVKSTLHLPKSYIPIAFFTVGYGLKKMSTPKRKEFEEIIFNIKA